MEVLGVKKKSPGNVMNCPENQKNSKPGGGVGGGSFRGSKNQKSWKCHELPRKKNLNPGGGWGGGGGFRGQQFYELPRKSIILLTPGPERSWVTS